MQSCPRIILTVVIYLPALLSGQILKRKAYWSGGINAGMIGWSPSTLETTSFNHFHRTGNFGAGTVTDNKGNGHFTVVANTSLGVHAGITLKDKNKENFTSIIAEFQKNKACYSFNEPFPYTYKGNNQAVWLDADNYLKWSVGVMRTWRFIKNFSTYKSWYGKISFGQTFNHTNFGAQLKPGDHENWTQDGTGMTLQVLAVNKTSWMLSTEIGRRFMLKNGNAVDVGLVYHAPFADTRTVQYEFYNYGKDLGPSRITYHGSTLMLNLGYTLNRPFKERPVDSTAIRSKYEGLAVDTTEARHDGASHHHKVNGRHFVVQETMEVSNNEVTVLVWDKNRVDGDEISLFLNGKPVLENYTVSKTRKEIILKLEPGSNILVMYALNLGRVPPNTAALNINDGNKKKNITLVSDLHQSGALEIIYHP